jgi:hypothetical protein
VHKLVLLASSPYLQNTYSHANPTAHLEVNLPRETGISVAQDFLKYMYEGVLHISPARYILTLYLLPGKLNPDWRKLLGFMDIGEKLIAVLRKKRLKKRKSLHFVQTCVLYIILLLARSVAAFCSSTPKFTTRVQLHSKHV